MSPPVLRVVPFDREPYRLGTMWTLHKNGKKLTCSLWNHATAAWELRVELDSELVRSQAFRVELEVLDTADAWKAASEAKGWQAPD